MARQGLGSLESTEIKGLFLQINRIEEAFEAIQRSVLLGIKDPAKIIHGVRNSADRFGQSGSGGVGVAAALEFLGNLKRLAIAAAQAGNDDAIGAAEERHQNGVSRGL